MYDLHPFNCNNSFHLSYWITYILSKRIYGYKFLCLLMKCIVELFSQAIVFIAGDVKEKILEISSEKKKKNNVYCKVAKINL